MSETHMEQETSTHSAFDRLNEATRCIDRERQFLDALMHTEAAGRTANRIICLSTIFDGLESAVPAYLHARANILFTYKPEIVAGVLSMVVREIVREARLSAYLCAKGVFPQAISVLRRGVELIGLYAHIWHDPAKVDCLNDPDSHAYRDAFVFSADKNLSENLKRQRVRFRFVRCSASRALSTTYELLSEYFTHATSLSALVVSSAAADPAWSCAFIPRQAPEEYEGSYAMAQGILGLLLLEIQNPIPRKDLCRGELEAVSLIMATVGPLLTSPDQAMPAELQQKVGTLLESLRKARSRDQ